MLRIIFLWLVIGTRFSALCGEIQEGLEQSHYGVSGAAGQLSDAIDRLSHIVGPRERTPDPENQVTAKTVLNGLKQMALDPAFEPSDRYEFLIGQEAQASNLEKKKEIQNKIQDQIKTVMKKMGFEPLAAGSATFQRGQQRVNVRFSNGEILVNPLVPLPPVEPQ